jgi:RNA polymerase sigma factor (sigma-70 family)
MTAPESSSVELPQRTQAEEQFARLYAEHGRAVLSYALPRAACPEDAADAVADTFLIAWRRADDVPPGADARFWLFGIARRTLANQQRGARRRTRLAERLRAELAGAVAVQPPEPDCESAAVRYALDRLEKDDRELLLLAGREELKSPQIALVLGISAGAARTRLHRARRRLRTELAAKQATAGASHTHELGCEEG